MEATIKFGLVSGTPWADTYIVGGGPSLKGFDFGRLCGRTVVAVNDAAIHLPFATALFSLDAIWIEKRRDLIETFPGERYLAVPEDRNLDTLPTATYLKRLRRCNGLTTDRSCISVYSGNSGFGALNLAVHKESKRVILLGFDFCHARVHWHDGYEWSNSSNDQMYANWAQRFDEVAPQLRAMGVEVVNASPISKITAFRKIGLEEV